MQYKQNYETINIKIALTGQIHDALLQMSSNSDDNYWRYTFLMSEKSRKSDINLLNIFVYLRTNRTQKW